MSTEKTLRIDSNSLEDTLDLAARIGSKLNGGEVIELISDLGGGKTVFVRGLAKGMGSDDQVASPTFTISREYKAKNIELHHFDFYRLSDPGVVTEELSESINDPKVAVAVEWSDIVKNVLPKDRLTISITKTGDKSRNFEIIPGQNHERLISEP